MDEEVEPRPRWEFWCSFKGRPVARWSYDYNFIEILQDLLERRSDESFEDLQIRYNKEGR